MDTYITYKCDTCKRTTEIEVDPKRPIFTKCTITYKCLGKLQRVGEKNVRSQFAAAPINGLTNWKPRNFVSSVDAADLPVKFMSLKTGKSVMTIAASVDDSVASVMFTYNVEQKTNTAFKHYMFKEFSGVTPVVTGADSSSQKNILRFNTNNSSSDTVLVQLNGIKLTSSNVDMVASGYASSAGGEITNIVIENPGDLYVNPPTLIIGGINDVGSGATGTVNLIDGKVDSVTIVTGGQGYVGSNLPISFIRQVIDPVVYVKGANLLKFDPPIKPNSTLDIFVTPFVSPIQKFLMFTRNIISNANSAWGNVKTIGTIDGNYALFTSDSTNVLDSEVHLIPMSLTEDYSGPVIQDWFFLLADAPFENADRFTSFKQPGIEASIYRTKNSINVQDVLVSANVKSVYPVIAIVERLSPDTIQNSASSMIISPLINSNIVGSAQ